MLILFSYLLSLSPSLFFLFFSFTGTLWPLMGGLLKSVLHYNVCLSENRNCSSLVITSSSIETVSILFRCLHFLCVSFFFHLLPLLNWHPLLQKIKNKKIERRKRKSQKMCFVYRAQHLEVLLYLLAGNYVSLLNSALCCKDDYVFMCCSMACWYRVNALRSIFNHWCCILPVMCL